MDEKEMLERLERINYEIGTGELVEIIEWFQRRVAIKQVAENPPDKWDNSELPYVYRLGQEMQKEAHMELDFAIVYGFNTFDKAVHYGRLAQRDLKASRDKRYG